MSGYKRFMALILGMAIGASISGCGTKKVPTPSPTPVPRDTSKDTSLSESMVYSNSMANKVQSFFTDPDRNSYTITNDRINMVHELKGDKKAISYLKNKDGKTYVENTMDVYIENDKGVKFYSSASAAFGRMNTTRLGYYYYETHIRDMNFVNPRVNTTDKRKDISDFNKETWNVNDMDEPKFNEGYMSVSVNDSYDPYIFRTGLNIKNAEYNAIEVRMKVEGMSTTANLYFFTHDKSNFNPEQLIPFKINPDNKFHTYIIDIGASGLFTGVLNGIRFDLGNKGEKVTFEYVYAVKSESGTIPVKLDKTFHTYSDKMHQEFRIVASNDVSDLKKYVYEVKIKKSNVKAFQYRDKDGIGNDLNPDGKTVEYFAFDVKGAGILAFIIPPDNTTKSVDVMEESGYYVFLQYANLNDKYIKGESITFGNRLYTDTTHTFDLIDREAYLERNPLSGISVAENDDNAEFLGYDHMRGVYRFTMKGTDFNNAYYKNPDKYFMADISVKNDNNDRNIYVWMNTKEGCLESAALLDDTNTSVPIPLQVCKNFKGEYEEPFYDPEDNAYGDTFFPLSLKEAETLNFKLLNLYQNWGKFPLKQISSIQFHISYYHLSTGVTESNCIAPYFVYGKDLWTLPDFRGASGIMWESQPQFNSVGRLYFVSYRNSDGLLVGSEYTGSYIRSSGQTYADMDYSYISDCGSYKYTLRHVEFPQTDENRTYYSLSLEFLKDLTVNDVRNDFTIFSMDGRAACFNQTGYLDINNKQVKKKLDLSKDFSEIYTLGKEAPYFSYFDLVNGESIMNFGFILGNSEVIINGKKYDGNFAYRNSFDGNLNTGAVTLDKGKVSFKKGDTIKMDFILLPYGSHKDKDDDNVIYVRQDSVINRLKTESDNVVDDTYIPTVVCKNNRAEFNVSGGRNNIAVRVDGFTSLKKISIYEVIDGEKVPYDPSNTGYDGYTVHYNTDGTYGFSFIVNMGNEGLERTFITEN